MPTSTAERAGKPKEVVRCEDCNAVFRSVPWTEGFRCARCRSARCARLPIIGNAVDYTLADRTKGYALEDIRFAKIAQWSRLISGQQYQEAFALQNRHVGGQAPVPPMGEVMHKAGILKKKEIGALLAYRCMARPDEDDSEFAKLALQSGFVDEANLAQCMDAQRDLKRQGCDVPPLPCLVYEKRCLQENQIQAVLQKQQERGSGMIRTVHQLIEARTARPLDRLLGPRGSTRRKLRVPVFAVLLVCLASLLVRHTVHAAPVMAKTVCINPGCGNISAYPKNSDWPAPCELCPKRPRTVFPMSICARCGHEFINEKPGNPSPRCPKCGSTQVIKWIDRTVDVKAIQRATKSAPRPKPSVDSIKDE